jgi:hypothetical protein
MLIPQWAMTVGLVVIIVCAIAWMFSKPTDKSSGYAKDCDQSEPASVDTKLLNVPFGAVDYLLDLIENRIREIGETYQANGRSYHDDLEISALRAMSRQLGFDFEVSSIPSGFAVARYVHQPV